MHSKSITTERKSWRAPRTRITLPTNQAVRRALNKLLAEARPYCHRHVAVRLQRLSVLPRHEHAIPRIAGAGNKQPDRRLWGGIAGPRIERHTYTGGIECGSIDSRHG